MVKRTRAKHRYCGLVQEGEGVYPTEIRYIFTALRTGGGPGRYVSLPHCVIASDTCASDLELMASITNILTEKDLDRQKPLEEAVEYLQDMGYRVFPIQEGIPKGDAVLPRPVIQEVNRLRGEPI